MWGKDALTWRWPARGEIVRYGNLLNGITAAQARTASPNKQSLLPGTMLASGYRTPLKLPVIAAGTASHLLYITETSRFFHE